MKMNLSLKQSVLAATACGAALVGLLAGVSGYAAIQTYRQSHAISALEIKIEDLAFREAGSEGLSYVITGDLINVDAVNALSAKYKTGIDLAFKDLTARTGIERKALTAASDTYNAAGNVTGGVVKGPVKIFFRSWSELGGPGNSPVEPPNRDDVANAAYGGTPYVVDNARNLAQGNSQIKFSENNSRSSMNPDKFDFGTVYIAPKK